MEHDAQKSGGDSAAGGGDQEMRAMVKFELEAAEALAGLAHSSVALEDEDTGTHDDDGGADDSMAGDESENVLPPPEDAGATTAIRLEEEQLGTNTIINPVKLDDQEQCRTSFSVMTAAAAGGKSRQPLTESEKEERRLRRVLANRESARQTIRRRQAMFEDLSRKASDLAHENESLRREKELAVKEYDSLKSTNDCLKEQMAKLEAAAVGELQKGTESVPTEGAASSSEGTPLFHFDQSSMVPLHWHSLLQPMMQCRSQNDSATPSVFPATESWRPFMFTDQRSCNNIPNPGALLYVLPLPCFFPWRSPSDVAFARPSNQAERQTVSQMSSQCSTDFPCQSTLPSVINRESCPTVSNLGGDHHHSGFTIPVEGHHKVEGAHPNPPVLTPTPLSCIVASRTGAGGRVGVTSEQEYSSEEVVATVTGHRGIAVSEGYRELAADISTKPVDTGAATEARRRRRELMKLKSMQPGRYPVS
ncbi:OLC1v1034276C2 [Oldenlandia corymbosa var. corymbosa]|uniref:OLC1v1034276C2 n=1 Tax=Oldenlandia corymbosa var. corymbosa TaxID=529605 RepID=A0AAV1CRW2_OLDCO|nr:OLC1v1034276C2 [Oldenlandia corymbosa var. corymbosa]